MVPHFLITRIKPTHHKIWIEVGIGFDSSPFKDPLQMIPSEEEFNSIQTWCEEHQCGLRMSYDQFVFNTEKELGMFMLRWG